MQGTQTNGQQLLTARQVQGMLGIDRSTVYRMAEDGRLPALKIGRQWRFPTEQIARVLVITDGAPATGLDRVGIPVGLATAVISVAADLLGVMMVVTDMAGQPVTGVANPCPWFAARATDPASVEACVTEWQLLADNLEFEPQFKAGLLGFECARAYVRSGTSLVGMVLAGGLAPTGNHSAELYQLDDLQRARVLTALPKIATALSRAMQRGYPEHLSSDR